MMATIIWPTLCSKSSMELMRSHAGFWRSPWLNLVLDRKSSKDPRPKTRHTMPNKNLSSAPTAAVTSSTGLKCTHAITPSNTTSFTPIVNKSAPSMSVAHTPSNTNPLDRKSDSLTNKNSAWLITRYLVEMVASLSPARSCRLRFIFLANFLANFFSSTPAAFAAAARLTSGITHLRCFAGAGSAFPLSTRSVATEVTATGSQCPVSSHAYTAARSPSSELESSLATVSTSSRQSVASPGPSVSASSSVSSRTSSSTVARSSSSSSSSASTASSSMISPIAARCCSSSAWVSSARSASFAAARVAIVSFSFFSRISASLASRSSSTRRFASARVASGEASGSRKNLSTLFCASSHCAVASAALKAESDVVGSFAGESAVRTPTMSSP